MSSYLSYVATLSGAVPCMKMFLLFYWVGHWTWRTLYAWPTGMIVLPTKGTLSATIA